MKILITFIGLMCCLTIFSQYRQFVVGGTMASNRWYTPIKSKHPASKADPTHFTSAGVLLQWNSRFVFSVAVNPTFEKTTRTYLEEHKYIDWNAGTYKPALRERVFYADRFILPFMVKATIGKRIFFTPYIGMNYAVLLSSSYRHETFYQKTESDNLTDPFNQSNSEADMSDKDEINVFAGWGVVVPIKEKFLISLDGRMPLLFLSKPKSDDRNEFMSYNKPVITLSLAYQFNLKKESSYKFTTFHFRLAKTSEEK